MHTFNKIIFALKESVSGIIKNFPKALIQFIICFVSLVFFSVVFGVYYNVQDAAKGMKDKIEISVFVKDTASHEEILNIEEAIKNNSNVKKYSYVSKDEARAKGQEMFEDMPEMIEAIKELSNPFPSSFNIELKDANLTEQTAESFLAMPGVEVDGVKYGEEYMDKILNLSDGLIIASYLALIFFFVIAVFFMISIINVIISQKEEESKIMFMIGASPLQITFPFYMQGVFIGLLASTSAYCTFIYLYKYLSSHLTFVLCDLSSVDNTLFVFMVITGLVSGVLATKLALLKFNKVRKNVTKKINA